MLQFFSVQALIESNEYEIYEQLMSIQSDSKAMKGALGSQFVSQRAKIILEEVRQLSLFTRHDCLQFLGGLTCYFLLVKSVFFNYFGFSF